MKKKNFLLLGIFVALLTFIGSMQAQQAKDYFNFDERGEAYFSFKVPDRAVLQELALIMSIDEFDPVPMKPLPMPAKRSSRHSCAMGSSLHS